MDCPLPCDLDAVLRRALEDQIGRQLGLDAEAAAAATGLTAIGDDAGLDVEALGGFPGIVSARLAPTQMERTRELLRRLAGVARPWRARFICALALAERDRPTRVFEGMRAGEVVPEWRGAAGFGYDPIFLVPEADKTFGEMEPAEKHAWSHRGAAVRALLESGALRRGPAAR